MIKYSKSDFLVWSKNISTRCLWTLNIWRKIAWVKGRTRFFFFFFSLTALRLPALILVGLKQIFSITVTWVRAGLGGWLCAQQAYSVGTALVVLVTGVHGAQFSPCGVSVIHHRIFTGEREFLKMGKGKHHPATKNEQLYLAQRKCSHSLYLLSFTCMPMSDVMWL